MGNGQRQDFTGSLLVHCAQLVDDGLRSTRHLEVLVSENGYRNEQDALEIIINALSAAQSFLQQMSKSTTENQ